MEKTLSIKEKIDNLIEHKYFIVVFFYNFIYSIINFCMN